jgi:hypothetical protein
MFFKKRKSRPTAEEVARRLLVLNRVVVHALATPPREMLAERMKNWTDDERKEFAKNAESASVGYWGRLRDLGLWHDMSAKEKALASSTAVSMTHKQHLDAMWRLESAQTLMWALGLLTEMPPYDLHAPSEILKELPSVHDLLKAAMLRPQTEIDRARDVAELWHWRSRTRQVIEEGHSFRADEQMKAAGIGSFDDIVRFAAKSAHERGDIPAPIDMDFPVKGKAYRELSAQEWSEVNSITMERHVALNWLCGYARRNLWDETPTDT